MTPECQDCKPVIPAADERAPEGYEAVRAPGGWLHVIRLEPCVNRKERVTSRPDCAKCVVKQMWCDRRNVRTTRSDCAKCAERKEA